MKFRADDEYISLPHLHPNGYGDTRERYVGSDSGMFSTNPIVSAGLKITKDYWISREDLASLLAANKVVMRAHLINAKYLEEVMENYLGGDDRMEFVTAKQALKRFISRVDAINN